jgi:pimeloyl-ACP methyl ester carboxylesterase
MEETRQSYCFIRNHQIPGSKLLPILLDVHAPESNEPVPVVIFCHGFKGFKDWGHFDLLGETFAKNGLAFLKFNFSHNGTTPEDPMSFRDLDAFGNNNYIIELDDLRLVIDWTLNSLQLKGKIDPQKIYLFGHSRGGGIAILKAQSDHRIRKIATWASVSTFVNRNKKVTVETWKSEGVVYTANARTGQQMPLYRQFYDIMMANKARLNVLAAARKLQIPFLIVHGDADEAVPFAEAEALHRSAPSSHLLRIEKGTHTFGGKHPWSKKELPEEVKKVAKATIEFFAG